MGDRLLRRADTARRIVSLHERHRVASGWSSLRCGELSSPNGRALAEDPRRHKRIEVYSTEGKHMYGKGASSAPDSSPTMASMRRRSVERRERERHGGDGTEPLSGRKSLCGQRNRGVVVDGIRARLVASLGAKIDGIKADVIQNVGQSHREMDEAAQARLDHIEHRAGQDRSSISVREQHAQTVDERLHRLEKELSVVQCRHAGLCMDPTALSTDPASRQRSTHGGSGCVCRHRGLVGRGEPP